MVARFLGDDQVFRAKVTAVRKGPDHQSSYDVLSIDYGNSYEDLSHDDLGQWDPLYEKIQPQAYLCSLRDLSKAGKMKPDVFKKVMTSQGAMKMEIFKVSPFKCGFFKASQRDFGVNVELSVSLTTEAGKDVCKVLAAYCGILGQDQSHCKDPRGKRTAGGDQLQLLLRSLDILPARFATAPLPLHLEGEQRGLSLSPPLSPIPPETTVQSVLKVFDWLENTVTSTSAYQVSDKDSDKDP